MTRAIKKLSIQTSGCRLNQYESEKMAAELTPFGFERVNPGEVADLYIINTCTITHRADASSRHLIRQAARSNPDGAIIVAGCYVDSDPEKVAGMEGVDLLLGNAEKKEIAKILPSRLPDLFTDEPDKSCSAEITNFHGHNRAWMGISDGCQQRCSYCILPSVRGDRLRHRSPETIVADVKTLVETGFNEVCLTGLNIGYYKWKANGSSVANLSDLCRKILDETKLSRLRLSSIEPQTVDKNIIELFQERSDQLCRHLHISMQSGSSRILKLMRRPYDRDGYIKRVTMMKEALPNMIIGADIIVGFPGETDADFNDSRSVAESGLIDYLHSFSYSDRPGTDSSLLKEKVDPRVAKERNAILTRISNRTKHAAHQRQVGETLGVISELNASKDRFHCGVADNYIRVKLPEGIGGGREIVQVKIISAEESFVTGELAQPGELTQSGKLID